MPAGAKAHLDCRSRSSLSRLDAALGRITPHNFPFPSGASAPQTLSQSGTEYFPTALAYLGNTHTDTQTHVRTYTYIRHLYIFVFQCLRVHTSAPGCARSHTHMYHHPAQQWLTVFGGICFMLVDLIDFQNGKDEPDNARSVIGIIIVMSVLPNPLSLFV
jgi:hypothetical protein